jgi:hypothetical protein
MRLIRWAQYAPLVLAVVGAGGLPLRQSNVSHYDGSYVGTIECDQIPGLHPGAAQARVHPADRRQPAQYARPLILPPTRLCDRP